jgi:thiol-disulfide isomerase/thioredoxin
MKKLILTAIIAITAWCATQAQSAPVPERYNELIEQVAQLEQRKAEFLMKATMETLAKDPKGYRQMMELAEKRFSDPADPIHNEGVYLEVLKHASENYVLSAAEREKQRLLLVGAKKNMIGKEATDFDYVTAKDKTVHHLKDLKADNILVYFNNPDCESCEAVKERLAKSELINQLVNDKKLIVLAIYPYDDQKLWKKAKYPSMMINGWNQSRNIEYNELYDLPTLPCFYLLDKDYKVLIKNEGSLNKVEAKLNELTTAAPVGPAPEPPTAKPEAKPESKPLSKATLAPADDPNTARSEQMLGYILDNKGQDLYGNLSDKMKSQIPSEAFDGVITKVEEQMGAYQSHEPWEIRPLPGKEINVYSTVLNFEKGKASFMVVYEEDGKIGGINMSPMNNIKARTRPAAATPATE